MDEQELFEELDKEVNPRTFFEWELGAALSTIMDLTLTDDEFSEEEAEYLVLNAEEVLERWYIKYKEYINELRQQDT